jgi:hypothetical protein
MIIIVNFEVQLDFYGKIGRRDYTKRGDVYSGDLTKWVGV